MPNYTPNHGYQQFADSEENWQHRTDFGQLDTDVEVRDYESNRHDYEPKVGAKFVATDTGERFIGDGDSWNQLPYPTEGGGGTSGTAQGGEAVVTSGSQLQSALNNNGVVRISGRVDISDHSPITVPSYRSVFGFGSFERQNHPREVDVITDDSSGPSLHVTGNHVKLFGFAISQQNKSSGIALKVEGYSPNISHLDIDGGYKGIVLGDRGSSATHTEPRVMWCKIFPYNGDPDGSTGGWSPGSGSHGILVEDMHDAKLIHNIIGGYDTGIELRRNHAYLTGNHIYGYPANGISTGIRLGNTGNAQEARYVRVVGNRVEDGIGDNGIRLGDWFGDKTITNNLLEVGSGSSGIERTTSDSAYPNMIIRNNVIRSSGSTSGGVAMDIAPRNTHSNIGGNVIDNMSSIGNAVLQSNGAPSASDHMPGAVVHDTSNGNLYFRTSSGMMQL